VVGSGGHGPVVSRSRPGLEDRRRPLGLLPLPLRDDPETSLVVWTTTPWTLPSNVYVAVDPNFDYVVVRDGAHKLIVASALRESLEQKLKRPLDVIETKKGSALVGLAYVPPFDVFYQAHKDVRVKLADGSECLAFWRVLVGDFVTLDTVPASCTSLRRLARTTLRCIARPCPRTRMLRRSRCCVRSALTGASCR